MPEEKKKRSLIDKFILAAGFTMCATGFTLATGNLVGLSDEEGARSILRSNGYTEAEHKGKAGIMKSCGNGAFWRDEFNARNIAGNKVNVTVCQGPFQYMEIKQWNPNP